MKRIVVAATILGSLLASISPSLAQRSGDPNIGHFYMARQQIDIIDDAPAVQDRRTQPAPPGAAGAGAGMPAKPIALPKAGWVPYSSSLPTGMSNGLPKVVNGVPPKMPQAPAVNPNMAKAGAYKNKAKAPAAQVHSGPTSAKTYAPYKGYGAAPTTTAASVPVNSGSSGGTSTAVSGSLLHWRRTGH